MTDSDPDGDWLPRWVTSTDTCHYGENASYWQDLATTPKSEARFEARRNESRLVIVKRMRCQSRMPERLSKS